jgi:hypothetical protein
LEYQDQDPRIHYKWLQELKATGVASEMGEIFDEPSIAQLNIDDFKGVIQMPKSTGLAV